MRIYGTLIAVVGYLACSTAFIQRPAHSLQRAQSGIALRMSIQSEVVEQMKDAMKAKDSLRLNALRGIKAAFTNVEKETGAEPNSLTEEQCLTVLRKMAKMRQESIEMFEKGGATDRAEAEAAELQILEQWLPKLANEETTRKWVLEAIEATGGGNMGKAMGALMAKHKAELDGKLAQKLMKELI